MIDDRYINPALDSTYQSFSPFALSFGEKEVSASPTEYRDSPLSARAHSITPHFPVALDPSTALKRIIRFLSKKVGISKTLREFRAMCVENNKTEKPGKPIFFVQMVSIDDYPKINETIVEWKSKIEELLKRKDLSECDSDKLYNASFILLCIEGEMIAKLDRKSKGEYKRKSLLLAKDSSGIIQSFAFVSRAYMSKRSSKIRDYHLDCLVTSPANLKLSFQNDCVSGSATALIEEIVFRCLQHTAEKGIALTALPLAASYYEKLGFIHLKSNKHVLIRASFREFLSIYGGGSLPSY